MFDTQLRRKHGYYRVEPACSHLLQASSPRPSLTGTMDVSVVDVQSSTSLSAATLSSHSYFPSTTSLVSQTYENVGLEHGLCQPLQSSNPPHHRRHQHRRLSHPPPSSTRTSSTSTPTLTLSPPTSSSPTSPTPTSPTPTSTTPTPTPTPTTTLSIPINTIKHGTLKLTKDDARRITDKRSRYVLQGFVSYVDLTRAVFYPP
ncbi:hypothetical protein BC629DRAFT_1493721 [Irpex lacteus]|nr:hypothetical protein BC629DRAFT_1493721 [Irpex lacteus]